MGKNGPHTSTKMPLIGVTVFALVLWMSLVGTAQDTGAQRSAGNSQGTTMSSKKEGAKLQHLKGKISDDGKSFTTNKGNKTYAIENSDRPRCWFGTANLLIRKKGN